MESTMQLKRKLTDNLLNRRRSPYTASPPTKRKRVFEERPLLKRSFSKISTVTSEISSDCGLPLPNKREISKVRPLSGTTTALSASDFSSSKSQRLGKVAETTTKRRGEVAAYEDFGHNLGLNTSDHWFNKGGMRWSGVFPHVHTKLAQQSPPEILVVHTTGNVRTVESTTQLKRKLTDNVLNWRRGPYVALPPTKRRKERPSLKRPFSKISTVTSEISSDCGSPPPKKMKISNVRPLSETSTALQASDFSPSKCQRLCKVAETTTKVWIIGSSYIRRAEAAAYEEFGHNLGLNTSVHWFGKGGMRWSGVIPRFYTELAKQSPPDILVVHAGGNDLGLVSAEEHATNIKADLVHLHKAFPSMAIIFSAINERKAWRYGPLVKIHADLKIVNSCIKRAAGSFGGRVTEHPFLRHFEKVFLPDRVHFNQLGNRIFLTSIRNDVREILQRAAPSHRS